MGNYNQVYYTDYRWIKQITEESNKTLEKNKEENLKYFIPLPKKKKKYKRRKF